MSMHSLLLDPAAGGQGDDDNEQLTKTSSTDSFHPVAFTNTATTPATLSVLPTSTSLAHPAPLASTPSVAPPFLYSSSSNIEPALTQDRVIQRQKSKESYPPTDELDQQIQKSVRVGSLVGLLGDSEAGDTRLWTLRTVYLGFAFCLIFTAFNVAQAYLTIIYPTIGTITLGILYGFFAVGAVVLAPIMGDMLGPKGAMCAASVFFAVFIGCLNTKITVLVLFSAMLVGLASGTLWINQGVWLSRLCDRTGGSLTGYFTGLFFTICNLNGITGNLLAIALLKAGLGIPTMIWSMFGVAATGSFLLLFANKMTLEHSVPQGPKPNVQDQVWQVWTVAKMRQSLVVAPAIWVQGCNLGFAFGRLPELLPRGSSSVAIAEVFLCYGIMQCTFSYINGIIYDKFGSKPLTALLAGSGGLAYFTLLTLLPSLEETSTHHKIQQLLEPYLLVGGLLGLFDTTLNTVINLQLSRNYAKGGETAAAFGFYRVGFCAAMSFVSLVGGWFSVGWVLVWNTAWVAVAWGSLWHASRTTTSETSGEKERLTGAGGDMREVADKDAANIV
ncbi:major facilitator superfamily domain-containing protein [Phlyctochytrium arcticum]|nr:major facilitator superfamily domain-containing protein [Phlyctochytrium arcticum]